MQWLAESQIWPARCLGIGLALGLLSCAHVVPSDAPVVNQVLGDKTLREQLVEPG